MTQRNNHPQKTFTVATAQPQGQGAVLRAAPALPGYVTIATLALITVLVLITGPISAEYGFV